MYVLHAVRLRVQFAAIDNDQSTRSYFGIGQNKNSWNITRKDTQEGSCNRRNDYTHHVLSRSSLARIV